MPPGRGRINLSLRAALMLFSRAGLPMASPVRKSAARAPALRRRSTQLLRLIPAAFDETVLFGIDLKRIHCGSLG
jgi:hypothetical protein